MTQESSTIILLLERHRARMRTAILVRWMFPSVLAATVAAEAAHLWRPDAIDLLRAVIGVVAALALAAVIAMRRTPQLDRVAALLDARLRLDDRLVSAFQHRADADPVSRLVAADAEKHLTAVDRRRATPIRFPRGWTWMVLLFAATQIVWFSSDAAPASPIAGASGSRASAANSAAIDERAATPARAGVDAAPAAAVAPAGDRPTHPPSAGTTPAAGPAVAPTSSSATSPSGDRGDAAGRSGARARAEATGSGGTRAGAAGGAGANTDSGRAGGVSHARVSPASAAPPPASPQLPSAAVSRAAAARAEAAIAADRVPPSLRDYVRRYFSLIHGRF